MIGKIFKFSWKNIWRNKRRTYFTLTAIAFGVMVLIFLNSYTRGLLNGAVEETIKTQTGHIKVAHKEFLRLKNMMPREYFIPGLTRIQGIISRIPGVQLSCARIKFNVLLNREGINERGIAIGIDPQKTEKSMEISRALAAGNYEDFNASGLNLIIGKPLARKLNFTINDEILLVTTDINYSTYALPFKIVGIFETGYSSMDNHILFIPLKKAQEMLDCGDAAHEVLIFLKDPQKAVEISKTIEERLSKNEKNQKQPLRAVPWQQDDYVKNFMPIIENIVSRVLVILMLLVSLVILNTMLMSIMERYHEIGVIKALGFKDGEVRLMIMIEAFFLGTIGSLVGGTLGGALSALTGKIGIDHTKMLGKMTFEKLDAPLPLLSKVLYPDLTLSILIGSIIFGILVSLAAALYPAFKSSKMLPVEALRLQLKV